MKEPRNRRKTRWVWLCASLASATLLAFLLGVFFFYLRHIKESHIRSGCIQLAGALKEWDRAGRPEGEALAGFMLNTQDPRGYHVTNTVLVIEGKRFQTIFATIRIGTPGVLLVTTNGEFLLFEPARTPRLLFKSP